MKSVEPFSRLSERSDSVSSRLISIGYRSPRKLWTGGRGRPVGTSSTSGAPDRRSRQNASCSASTGPASHPLCQCAKSPY
jgi:hypothetical protein